jgi:hypothetical protein
VATSLWVAARGHHIALPYCDGGDTREQPLKDTIEVRSLDGILTIKRTNKSFGK